MFRKLVLILGLFLVFCSFTNGQTAHTVTLNWTLSTDDVATICTTTTTCTQTLYRAPKACTVALSTDFIPWITGITASATSVVDNQVTVGNSYCYQLTFIVNNLESLPSNQVIAVILPSSQTNLTKIIK